MKITLKMLNIFTADNIKICYSNLRNKNVVKNCSITHNTPLHVWLVWKLIYFYLFLSLNKIIYGFI